MNESGFAIEASQSSRALVSVKENSSWKVISGRQEWIAAIEFVSAAGAAIPPLIVFNPAHQRRFSCHQEDPAHFRPYHFPLPEQPSRKQAFGQF